MANETCKPPLTIRIPFKMCRSKTRTVHDNKRKTPTTWVDSFPASEADWEFEQCKDLSVKSTTAILPDRQKCGRCVLCPYFCSTELNNRSGGFLTTDTMKRRKFILKLAKALLSFGAPSHRIESQLRTASKVLDAGAGCPFCYQIMRSIELIKFAQSLSTFQTSS
jgi:hypothetical protein